ncbi:Resolvase, N terminal domain [Salmonella enterica]|nr:Resolvase, N terminal domain [Salmonella enterica]SUF49749.1 Resolvase, N terminal domain [Salmonella enterica]
MKLALGTPLYAPGDPMGKMLFNVVATFAEFEGDLIRLRTREGMGGLRANGTKTYVKEIIRCLYLNLELSVPLLKYPLAT